MDLYRTLLSRIRSVRRSWRFQALVRGMALFLAAAAALLVLGVWGADLFGFRPAAVWTMRVVTGGLALYVALRFIWFPLRRNLSDVQVARYIEERYPQLQDRLVAAVEFGANRRVSPGLLQLLLRDAAQKVRLLDFRVFLNRRRLLSYAGLAACALACMAALMSWGPAFLPYGFHRLYVPWLQAADNRGLLIEVEPGDTSLIQGSDQEIAARLVGFDAPEARLMVQPAGKSSWQSYTMEAERRGNRFLYLLADVRSSLRYYVEAGGMRSPSYTILVSALSEVERIDATYNFPAYTGMKSQTIEDEGDLSALQGTKVDLEVRVTQPAAAARLLFDDRSTLNLAGKGGLDFSGSLEIRRSGTYVVQLAEAGGRFRTASREYAIEALEDAPPRVSITRPLRDVRATSVEEVFAEVAAEDDIGLTGVQLHYSVNGGPEQVVGLYSGKPPGRAAVSGHTFFLEDFGLQPGDLVSYYARAADNNNLTGPGTSSSDIYFIQVRPFDNRYTQSQQGAPPGGAAGGGSEAPDALSRQQKDIIAATFRLLRDQEILDPKEYSDGLGTLALVQSRLQNQTQGVIDRMTRRGVSEVSEEFARMTDYLKGAVEEMQKAAVSLGARKPADALPDEQKALQQLLRAESLFRDIQISFGSNQGGGGGGGSQASAEDLADLFELELNKLKNQYETVQRGERQQRDQQLDEAMERVKELARRQQQLNERSRIPGQRSASSSGGDSRSQQQLAAEAEELARRLQRLSRERSSPELDRVGSQLRQAIQEMRRALQNRQAGRDASAQSARALEKLEEARRSLARQLDAGLNRGVDAALEEARQLEREQERIQSGIDRMIEERERANQAAAARLAEELSARKEALAERLRNLESGIQELARQARKEQPETSTHLNEAAGGIREKRLQERILSGNRLLGQTGYLEALKAREDYIRAGLDELSRKLEEARKSIGETREGRLAGALERTRQLADGLESMQRRLQGLSRDQARQQERAAEAGGRGARENRNPGQQAAGRPGQADALGWTQDTRRPPAPAGPPSDEDRRQLGREAQQRLADAQELRRMLDRNSTQWEALEEVIARLRRLDDARRYDDPEEGARLREAIDLLRRVEVDLSRELAKLTRSEQYLYADDNQAPSSYRKLVEEYYKALARSKPR